MKAAMILLVLFASVACASENLTVIVVKPSIDETIQEVSKNGFIVGFRLVCVNAAADTVIDKIFTEGFNLGDSPNEFRRRIGKKMQKEIDRYQRKHTLFNAVGLNASAALIRSGLNGAAQ